MAPTKHAATKKPSSKHACTDSDNFRSAEADMKYNDCYKGATIIMERVVQLESLKDTFIPEVFKERTWTKLLNPVGVVFRDHKGVFLQCCCERRSYRVLGETQGICDYKRQHSRIFGDSSSLSTYLSPI